MSIATIQDWIDRIDEQIIGDLVTDDDPNTGLRERPTRDQLLANGKAQVLLDDAQGAVEVAMRVSKRYSPAQLAGLTGASLSHLKRVLCSVATALGFERRPDKANADVADKYRERADQYLNALQAGKNIFGLADESDETAGLPQTDGPSVIDLETNNSLVHRLGRRHLIDDADRLPVGR